MQIRDSVSGELEDRSHPTHLHELINIKTILLHNKACWMIYLKSLRICPPPSVRVGFYLIFLTDFYKIVLKKISGAFLSLLLPGGRISYVCVTPDGCLSNWSWKNCKAWEHLELCFHFHLSQDYKRERSFFTNSTRYLTDLKDQWQFQPLMSHDPLRIGTNPICHKGAFPWFIDMFPFYLFFLRYLTWNHVILIPILSFSSPFQFQSDFRGCPLRGDS